jgi:Na+-driven multidrug efflux pump
LAYNKDLVEGYQVFNIYLLLIISRMIFPQTVIMGLMKNRVFYLISTNYLIINLILSFWFVQLGLGLRGIAYATVISYIIEKIMLVIYCKTQGVDVKKYTPIGELILYSIITIVAYILSLNFNLPDLASF